MDQTTHATRLRPQSRRAKHTPAPSRGNNGPMQAGTGSPRARLGATLPPGSERGAGARTASGVRPGWPARVLGYAGLAGVVASVALVAAGAAAKPGALVPARSGGWPDWLAGPLRGLDFSIGRGGFQALTLLLCAAYLVALACAHRLDLRAVAAAIVAAHVALLLGPPLLSQDVFGYLGYARLGALHGLDPYTHLTAEAPADAVFPFLGWPFKHSPYGPLFTLASYATAPLGVAGGLWAFKALAVLCSLGAVTLIARACARAGRSPAWAAAFVGLNPVLLELAVGGAHNDTLLLLALAAALALSAAASPRLRASATALVAGVGVKVSAGLTLPFLLLAPARARERLRVA